MLWWRSKTAGEMIYENSAEKRAALDVQKNKKNRVTAAQFVLNKTIANTPRSPRLNTKVPQNAPGVNPYSMQDGENNSQNSIVNRPWLQGDTSVDMYGNPVETPHTTRTASAQSAADKAFFDTVRRYLPDGGEHSSPAALQAPTCRLTVSRARCIIFPING